MLDFLPNILSKFSPYFLEKPALTCLCAKSDESRERDLDNIKGFGQWIFYFVIPNESVGGTYIAQ